VRVLRENAVIQSQVARAEAGWRAARLFLHDTIAGAWSTGGPDRLIPMEQRVLVRLASTNAIHASAQIVDTVFHAAGATAIFASNPFERRFRDIHAVTQQVQGSQMHFESAGQFFLGLEPDTTWL
jgi:alkylation response protein AidB-like acyl-CoA dehydrogenase